MVKSLITFPHCGNPKYGVNVKYRGANYHGILTLENVGTAVNYCGIFVTLAPWALS
jgi:hypothetical protein